MFIYPWGDMHSLNLGWFLLQFKDWIEKIQEYLDNGGGTSENLANVIAPVFNAANTYAAGDYVLYNNELYKANQPVNPGTWDPDAWDNCLIVDEMGGGSAGVDNVARLMIAGQYSATFAYQKYGICRYNDKLWMCNTDLPAGGEAWNPAHWDEITVGAGLSGLRRSVDTLAANINANGKNPLAGKKVGFWGDSIMYGLLQDSSRSNSNYPKVFGDLTGATIENNAYSGASITNYDEHSFINIYQTINWNNYDIVVLGYGANDVGHGETIANIQTAFETVTGYMMNYNPNLIIALCSPTYGTNLTGRYQPSNICLNDVYYIVRNVAKGKRIKFIDFLYGSSINEININTLSWDGLHFNDAGYYKLGEYLASNLLGETIHDVIDFGNHAQKLQVQHFGGNAGCNLYIYGDDNTIYSITFYINAMALIKSDDGGATWSTLWTLTPTP